MGFGVEVREQPRQWIFLRACSVVFLLLQMPIEWRMRDHAAGKRVLQPQRLSQRLSVVAEGVSVAPKRCTSR